MPEVRNVGAADRIEVALAALVDEPAALAADDLGILVAELTVEDVAVGVAVAGHVAKLLHGLPAVINLHLGETLAPRPMAGQRTLDPRI